jgi:pyruvate-formate lyase-activating enzyme
MKNPIINGTFCVLPWIEQHYDLNGEKYFCCVADKNLPITSLDRASLDDLRLKIWNGEQIPHCVKCYDLEKHKAMSHRLIESARWMRDPDVKKHCLNWEPGQETTIYFYDIRYDNHCNLACISCNPKDSSRWQEELGLTKSARSQIPFTHTDIIKAKKIYLAGGEPLFIDAFIDLLEYVMEHNPDMEVVINTNLTSVSSRVWNILSKLQDCCLTVSVDGHGLVNEYHRWPMSWNKFIRNLDLAKSHGLTIMFNTVADAISVFGFTQLTELDSYASYWNISILHTPQSLLLKNIPVTHKPLAISCAASLMTSKFYKTDVNFKSKVDLIITLINETGDSQSLQKYIVELDQRRRINHKEYLGINLLEDQ